MKLKRFFATLAAGLAILTVMVINSPGVESEFQILENTDVCLTDCYTIIRIRFLQDYEMDELKYPRLTVELSRGANNFTSTGVQVLKTHWKNVYDPVYGNCTGSFIENGTGYNVSYNHSCVVDTTKRRFYWDEWEDTDWTTFKMKKNRWYYLKIWGTRPPKLGQNNAKIAFWIGNSLVFDPWWNSNKLSRKPHITNATVDGLLINMNDTFPENYWIQNKTAYGAVFTYYDNADCTGNPVPANETDELDWENESSRTGNNPTSIWSDYVAVLHFGNGTGIIAHNSIGVHPDYDFSFRGTGEPVWTADGKFGNATFYDGDDDYIKHTTLWDTPPANGTISLWFKPAITYDSGLAALCCSLFWKGSDGTNYILPYFDVDGKLTFAIRRGGHPQNTVSTTTVWNAGQWYHVAFVWGGDFGVEMWVNGTKEGTNAHTGSWGAGTTWDFFIGSQTETTYPFNGTIDEFRAIERRLSEAEIQQEARNGRDNLSAYEACEVSGTCPCPASGDWIATCSDNCSITSDCDLQGNDFILTGGGGQWILTAKIFNYTLAHIENCTVNCNATGGCFKE